MESQKPLIIVTADYDYERDVSLLKNLYCEALEKAGAAPLLLPLNMNTDLLDIYINKCDGIMVTGGPDLDAACYGEENMPYNGAISPFRDIMELALIKKAVLAEKPVFGICRGIQSINVAMGGTLYQDIHQQIKDRQLIKHSQSAPRWYTTHQVVIKKGSQMWEVFKTRKVPVNSFHHQAVKDIAPGFEVTAWSDDGIIEAIEYTKRCYVVGVQWHPEDLWKQDFSQHELFKHFVNICSANLQ